MMFPDHRLSADSHIFFELFNYLLSFRYQLWSKVKSFQTSDTNPLETNSNLF